MGYVRNDGTVGTRNHLLILPMVQCANETARRIALQLDGSAIVESAYGCSQIGSDEAQTLRTISGFAHNPNAGAVILVGLKCGIDGKKIYESTSAAGKDCFCVNLDEFASEEEAVSQAVKRGLSIAQKLSSEKRTETDLSNLILGLECGGSDAWSGLSANPVTGECSDLLIEAGGSVILSETQEMIGAEHFFAAKAETAGIREKFLDVVALRERESIEWGVDISSVNPGPGNKAGGLTTIEEKSLGCMQKGGTRAKLAEVLYYAERPAKRGLIFMDTPGDDIESITGMVAGGCQAVIFTTGRGNCVGNPIVPVIKVSSNTPMFEHMRDNIDFNAGAVVDGKSTIASSGALLFSTLLRICGGEMTKSELLGFCNDFAITRTGITL
jgi:altronate dehydratase large subunit